MELPVQITYWNMEVHPEHKDLYVVIRDAFAIARRQLQDYAKRLRGEVKTHESRMGPGSGATDP